MRKKNRIPIPKDIAAKVLFLSDRTCCVCNQQGKQVQIHHIDEDPSNNEIDNLSVLCLEHHNDTMVSGGFGRNLDSNQVILYRNEWHARVSKRKEKADEIASIQTLTGSTETNIVTIEEIPTEFIVNDNPELLHKYLRKIVIVHNVQLAVAHTKWDTGITPKMNEGNSDMIDFYREILIELASFFPAGHFQKQSPEEYFSELIASKFTWYWTMNEPEGIDTGGTMASTISGGNVMMDLQKMIVEMVESLLQVYRLPESIDMVEWKKHWMN